MTVLFWESQRKARAKTLWLVFAFTVLTLVVACLGEVVLRAVAPESYSPELPLFGLLFLCVTVGTALLKYLAFRTQGGAYVAESLGGQRVDKNSPDFKERQLVNIVEEMALAAHVTIPKVYVLPAREINAFAAGLSQDTAAVAITRGALELLNRDEVQGVIAHEFGHIRNRDMALNLQLAAMLTGFFFILTFGMRMLRFSALTGMGERDEGDRRGNPLVVAAFIAMAAGVVTWFLGSILHAMVSRQREYLADACAVQYTRSTEGIANALRKIGKSQVSDMPQEGMAFSHLYFANRSFWGNLFATHPPLNKRIAAIEGHEYVIADE